VTSGIEVRRLPEKSGDPNEKLKDKLDRVAALTELLSLKFLPTRCTDRRTSPHDGSWHSFELASARRQTARGRTATDTRRRMTRIC